MNQVAPATCLIAGSFCNLRLGRKSLLLTTLVAGALMSLSVVSAVAQLGRPNIVIILADDLGYGDVSHNGVPDYATPNIDSLAANGRWCSTGYVTNPFCSPSRAALITGRYQQRYGYENNPENDNLNPRLGLPTQELTLPHILKPAGYICGLIGKWHLGNAPNMRPTQRGFDEFFGFLGGGSQYYNASLLRNDTPIIEHEYLTDAFTREGVSFINRHAAERFFLYLAYNAPHSPYDTPPQTYMDRVSNIADPQRQVYAAMITALDDGVGQVLRALQAHNLLTNTVIFFLSDNGAPQASFTRNYPLRGYKWSLWEGGIRVPFAVQWTGQLPAGLPYDQPISALDIVPTVAAVAGVSLPADRIYDGLNLLPYLASGQVAPVRTLFWRWFGLGATGPPGPGSRATIYAVHSDSLKLVKQRGSVSLYNLSTDITESNDLARVQPGDLASLSQLYDQWELNMVAPLWQEQNSGLANIVLAGDWNGFNKDDLFPPWSLTRLTAPGAQGTPDAFDWFINTIHVAAVGGDTTPGLHSFVFVGGGNYSTQWGGVTINIDGTTSVPFFSGGTLGPTNNISLEEGFYYSFRTLDWRLNADLTVAVMKTSAPPVSVNVVSQTPLAPGSDDAVLISIVTSQPKSVQERIYLRWSTDTYITSHLIEAAGSGVNYSAVIPAQPAGTSVQYCVTTSTVDLSQLVTSGAIDFLTLSTSTNSHFVVAPGPSPTRSAAPSNTPAPTPSATATPTPALSGLTYNGGTPFVNGTSLSYGTSYTVIAQANANTQSVVFKRDGIAVKTDSAVPFDFTWKPSTIGNHTFAATPWSYTNGTGTSGATVTVNFSVTAASSPTPTPTPSATATPTPALSGLTYNGGTPFVNGTSLSYGTSYTVIAQANANTQSVVFKRDGIAVKTDSAVPFDFTWKPSTIGNHTFAATPWSYTNGTGTSGPTMTVNFSVTAASSPTPTP